jgi:hypothetical protein
MGKMECVAFSLPAHERRLSCNHSRPPAAAIMTTMMLNGGDEVGSWLGVGTVVFASGAFGAGDTMGGNTFGCSGGPIRLPTK